MHEFITVWRSILVVSSWIGVGLGLCAFLTKSGIGFLVGSILIVFSIGGFIIASIIKRWLNKEVVGVSLCNGVITTATSTVTKDEDGNEWTTIDNKLYIKDPITGNFERFHNTRVKV